jgi:putative peptidoglycan lipid II flippase
MVLVLIVPATVGLLVLGGPIISLIFEHGAFTTFDTVQATRALTGYLLGTPFAAIDLLLIFAFYSQKDTVTPVIVGIVCVFIYLAAAPTLAFGLEMGMLGLVLANSLQLTSHAIITFVLLYRRVGNLKGQHLGLAIGKIGVASTVMGLCTLSALTVLDALMPGGGVLSLAIRIAGAALTGVAVYAFCIAWLRVREADLLFNMVRNRVRRG